MATSKFSPYKLNSIDGKSPTTVLRSGNLGLAYAGLSKVTARRSLIEFDLYGLAFEGRPLRPTDTITAMQLDLNCDVNNMPASTSMRLIRVTRYDWCPGEATWTNYKTGNAWTSGGGDLDTTTPTQITWTAPTATGAYSITGLVNFGTDAMSNRDGKVNIILKCNDEADDGISRWLNNVAAIFSGADSCADHKDYVLDAIALNVTYTPGDEPPIPDE